MDLYKELLVNALKSENISVTFPNIKTDMEKIVQSECYEALQKIKAVIVDDNLSDEHCFMKIEEIISILETKGIDCGYRHEYI